MHERIPSDPEEEEAEQVLLPEAHDLDPAAPGRDVRGAERTGGRVRLRRVPPHVAAALDGRDGEARRDRREQVQPEAGEVRQAEDTGDETREARRELGSAYVQSESAC